MDRWGGEQEVGGAVVWPLSLSCRNSIFLISFKGGEILVANTRSGN